MMNHYHFKGSPAAPKYEEVWCRRSVWSKTKAEAIQVWVVVSNNFLFSLLPREMIQFDLFFSDGLKPPTRSAFHCVSLPLWKEDSFFAVFDAAKISRFLETFLRKRPHAIAPKSSQARWPVPYGFWISEWDLCELGLSQNNRPNRVIVS